MEFACSLCFCVGSLWEPPLLQSKNMQCGERLNGDSKLPVGVNVSMDGYSSLYVSPAMNWGLAQGVPHLRPNMLRDRLQPPATPLKKGFLPIG